MKRRHFISKLVPTGAALPILAGPLRGARWIVGAASGAGKGMSVVVNQAEPRLLTLARSWLTPDSVSLDLGANVGLYTLLFARYGGHVHAFEPLPRNVAYLFRHCELNRLSNVTILPWALSDHLALARFQLGPSSALGRLSDAGTLPVVSVSLDEYARAMDRRPDVLKIDVEGAEERVLADGRELLAGARPKILLSIHGRKAREGCLERLREHGYRVTPLDHANPDAAKNFACVPSEI
ncbi:MAG: FkbM family methyltransferase [Polyangiaceae bacterium]